MYYLQPVSILAKREQYKPKSLSVVFCLPLNMTISGIKNYASMKISSLKYFSCKLPSSYQIKGGSASEYVCFWEKMWIKTTLM